MTWLISLRARSRAQLVSLLTLKKPTINKVVRNRTSTPKWDTSYREPSLCSKLKSDDLPCLDVKNLSVLRAMPCHAKIIRAFLLNTYWPREPSVVGLWMDPKSPYLSTLSDSYAYTGNRFVIFDYIERTNEYKLIGFAVANKKYPWLIDELKQWAYATTSMPEKIKMSFSAHSLENPDFFKKFNVDYIYDIDCIATADSVVGLGVDTLLLNSVLKDAKESRVPLVQVVSASYYTSQLCERCGMKREWTMNYVEFVDSRGQSLFYPRKPHHSVCIYVKYFDPTDTSDPCEPVVY